MQLTSSCEPFEVTFVLLDALAAGEIIGNCGNGYSIGGCNLGYVTRIFEIVIPTRVSKVVSQV